MKRAYVSLVLMVSEGITASEVEAIDKVVNEVCSLHEIVLIAVSGDCFQDICNVSLYGPVTLVNVRADAMEDADWIAGLARTSGDFVIEWRAPTVAISQADLGSLLQLTDAGVELVEVPDLSLNAFERTKYRLLNRYRTTPSPIQRSSVRVYSRRAVNEVLRLSVFERNLEVSVASLSLSRVRWSTGFVSRQRSTDAPQHRRASEEGLLARATVLGSVLPSFVSVVAVFFGMGTATYAAGVWFLQRRAPEGWTTLMIALGLSQAASLTMLGLLWRSLRSLTRSMFLNQDASVESRTWAPAINPSRTAIPGQSDGRGAPATDSPSQPR